MTKTCTRCNKKKEESMFGIKRKGYQAFCKECQRIYGRSHYKLHSKRYILNARKNDSRYRENVRDWIWEYFSFHYCVDCNEKDPVVLEFDHVNGKKDFNVTKGKMSLDRVKDEVKKCQVRCANCHRRRHAKERKTWKTKRIAPVVQ